MRSTTPRRLRQCAAASDVWPRPATCVEDWVDSYKLGQQLCQVFGLDAERVVKLSITVEAGTSATVSVEQWSGPDQSNQVVRLMARHALQPLSEPIPIKGIPPGPAWCLGAPYARHSEKSA